MRLSRHQLHSHFKKIRFGRRTALESLEPRLTLSHDGVESGPYVMPAELQDLVNAESSAPEGMSSPNPFTGNFTYQTLANGMPILNSYPSAPASIFIDFDGGVYHGTFTADPYDVDGSPTTFNLEEQGTIVEAWRQMSMYFAMFNVNVTTIQPATSTPKAWLVVGNNVSGGSSYINVFPDSRAESRNQSSDARGRVSGLAHEIGHNFGNQHTADYDNLGNRTAEYHSAFDTLHGPIMGIDYSGTIHKWTTWHDRNSPLNLQDDMLKISQDLDNYGGDGYRPDDYGGTIATATPLTATGNTQAAVGIIERLTDADAFKMVSTGGRYAISVGRDAPSGVDVKVSVYNAAGTLLASEDGDPRAVPQTMVNDAHLTLDLPPGNYYVIVESHGNYGDQGQYVVRVDPVPAGWSSEAVGIVGLPGSSSYNASNGTFTISGSGTIDSTTDEFHSLFQQLTGDGSITVRITSVENTNSAARAGIMIRDGLSDSSRNVALVSTPSSGIQWQSRSSVGGSTSRTTSGSSFTATWLRLVRSGNNFTAFTSSNGSTWTQLGSVRTVSMGSTVYVGLVASATNNLRLSAATFTNVSLTGSLNVLPQIVDLNAPTGLLATSSSASNVSLQWNAVALQGDFDSDYVVSSLDLAVVKQNFGNGAAGDVNGDGVTDLADYNYIKANLGATITGYAIERSADGVNYTQIGTTNALTRTYTDTGLSDAQRYFHRVRARNNSGVSESSTTINALTKAGAISDLNAISYSTSQIILDWSDASGESSYRIQRSNDGVSGWTSQGSVGANVPMFTDSGLSAGKTYYYKIETIVGGVVTATSNVLAASTRLPDVTGLAFTNVAWNQMAMTWNAVTGATGYRVERSTLTGGSQTLSSNWSGTTFTDNNVSQLGEYFYTITAINALSESEDASTIFAASPAISLALPSGWSTADVGSVGGSGATGYSGGIYTIIASGTDIWGTADQFRYVYTNMSGDGSITARVFTIEPDADWTFGGVMIRESTASGAKNVNVVVSPNHVSYIQWRSATNGASSHTDGNAVDAPYWVRLTRSGSTFTGEISADGVNWVTSGTATVSMNSSVLVGIVASSVDNTDLDTVTFTNVTINAGAGSADGIGAAAGGPVNVETETGAVGSQSSSQIAASAVISAAASSETVAKTENASLHRKKHSIGQQHSDRQAKLAAVDRWFSKVQPRGIGIHLLDIAAKGRHRHDDAASDVAFDIRHSANLKWRG